MMKSIFRIVGVAAVAGGSLLATAGPASAAHYCKDTPAGVQQPSEAKAAFAAVIPPTSAIPVRNDFHVRLIIAFPSLSSVSSCQPSFLPNESRPEPDLCVNKTRRSHCDGRTM